MDLFDIIFSIVISFILAGIIFVALRTKLSEKIGFIENNEKFIKTVVYLSLFSLIISILSLFVIFLDFWDYLGPNELYLWWLGISLSAFLISNLSINLIPRVYIRTMVKECNKEKCYNKEMRRERTDIQWKFDELLGGGLPLGYICLITGPPGVGISILSFEILYNGFRMRNQRGLFISMNETISQLSGRLNSVWGRIDTIQEVPIKEIRGDSPPYPYINWKRIFWRKKNFFTWEYPIYKILREHDNHSDLKRVVIDLPPFFEDIPKEQIIDFFDTLSKIAYGLDLLVVVTSRTRDSSLEQLTPIVINLNKKILHDGRAISSLSIKKNVGFPTSPLEYEFEIRGLELEKRNLAYKLKGLLFNERKGYEPFNEPIPGIWIFETSFKVGEKLHEKMG
jgi:KaiC/GvpD/RAD55 family RecA-like ATPase